LGRPTYGNLRNPVYQAAVGRGEANPNAVLAKFRGLCRLLSLSEIPCLRAIFPCSETKISLLCLFKEFRRNMLILRFDSVPESMGKGQTSQNSLQKSLLANCRGRATSCRRRWALNLGSTPNLSATATPSVLRSCTHSHCTAAESFVFCVSVPLQPTTDNPAIICHRFADTASDRSALRTRVRRYPASQ
jgi:hypothetical protein